MKRRAVLAAAAAIPVAILPVAARADAPPPRAPPPSPPPGPPPLPPPRSPLPDELRALLRTQAAQWTAGDLEGFCGHYADDAIFVSPSGRTDGRQAVYDRYKKKYVDKRGMGALTLDVLHLVADGTAASIAMKWRLAFEGKAPAEGYSVLGLEKRGDAWKIVHDASM